MTTLRHFARDMLAALDADRIDDPPFRGDYGLCGNLAVWCRYYQHDIVELINELKDKFRDKGLDLKYPFNKDRRDFNNEADAGRTFANPARMAFLKDLAQ